ncbi:MAG TPA: DJ-1/PfpI family protein [Nannocystaceae bacterium]|nr:DJ-1/PfpI family protein [Nannocystaceae bacterium]
MPDESGSHPRLPEQQRIAVFVFPDVEELDFVGPWEVLASWARGWPDDGIECFTLARERAEVVCAKGLRVVPDHDWGSAPPFDLLILPGGRGTRPMLGDGRMLAWVRDLADRGVTIASVCTGALVLAKCGLLDGKPATTHHGSLSLLRELGRDIDVQPEARFVDNGSILTASGVSAGIDLALHLIVRMHSVERARQLRRHIQYDPSPPV